MKFIHERYQKYEQKHTLRMIEMRICVYLNDIGNAVANKRTKLYWNGTLTLQWENEGNSQNSFLGCYVVLAELIKIIIFSVRIIAQNKNEPWNACNKTFDNCLLVCKLHPYGDCMLKTFALNSFEY